VDGAAGIHMAADGGRIRLKEQRRTSAKTSGAKRSGVKRKGIKSKIVSSTAFL
jgi:hypothetical protein